MPAPIAGLFGAGVRSAGGGFIRIGQTFSGGAVSGGRFLGGAPARFGFGGGLVNRLLAPGRGGARIQAPGNLGLRAQFKGFRRLQRIVQATPKELETALHAASGRVGKKFLALHARKRLRAKQVTSGLGPVVGTKRGLIGMRKFEVKGTKLSNLTLRMHIRSQPAVNLEFGRLLTGKNFRVPLKPALDGRGKVRKKFARMAKERKFKKITLPSGKSYLAKINKRRRKNKDGKKSPRVVFMFHLTDRIQMRPRLQFYKTWNQYKPKAMQEFRNRVGFALSAVQARSGGRD